MALLNIFAPFNFTSFVIFAHFFTCMKCCNLIANDESFFQFQNDDGDYMAANYGWLRFDFRRIRMEMDSNSNQ